MQELASSWHVVAAAVLMAGGAALAFAGMRRDVLALRMGAASQTTPLNFVRGFRLGVIGLALIGLGAAWMWGILWLAVLALIIGAEETFETTLLIYGLTRGAQLRLRP
jgi:hypothetical protein